MVMKISFCIPTYNRGDVLEANVKRILECQGNNFEVVVVDNNSPDDTRSRMEKINDPRLFYYKNSTNLGATLNMIETYKKARGEWIFSLSDEDYLTNDMMKAIMKYLESDEAEKVSVILGGLRKTYNDQHIIYKTARYLRGDHALCNVGFTHLYMSGLLIRKEHVDFNYLSEYSVASDGMYPYVNLLSLACLKGDAVTLELELCINGPRASNVSFLEKPNNISFKDPINRVRQFGIFASLALKIIEIKGNKISKIGDIYEHFLKLSTYHWENILQREPGYYLLEHGCEFNFEDALIFFHSNAVLWAKREADALNILDDLLGVFIEKNNFLRKRRGEFLNGYAS